MFTQGPNVSVGAGAPLQTNRSDDPSVPADRAAGRVQFGQRHLRCVRRYDLRAGTRDPGCRHRLRPGGNVPKVQKATEL